MVAHTGGYTGSMDPSVATPVGPPGGVPPPADPPRIPSSLVVHKGPYRGSMDTTTMTAEDKSQWPRVCPPLRCVHDRVITFAAYGTRCSRCHYVWHTTCATADSENRVPTWPWICSTCTNTKDYKDEMCRYSTANVLAAAAAKSKAAEASSSNAFLRQGTRKSGRGAKHP